MPTFELPNTTEEMFGITRSIYDRLAGVLGHPAISPSKQVGETLAGMVVPPTREAAANMAIGGLMPGYLSAGETGKKVMKSVLGETLSEYRRLQSLKEAGYAIDNPASRVLKRQGGPLVTALQGGIDITKHPRLSRMVESGISPYIEDAAATLRSMEGSGGSAFPYTEWPGRMYKDIFGSGKPESNLLMPSFIVRRYNDPRMWIDTLLHEGAHLQYRLNPDTAQQVLDLTRPYHRRIPNYEQDFMKAIQEKTPSKVPYDMKQPSGKFEESLVSGIARSAFRTATGQQTPYYLPFEYQNPLYADIDVLDKLARLFYGR